MICIRSYFGSSFFHTTQAPQVATGARASVLAMMPSTGASSPCGSGSTVASRWVHCMQPTTTETMGTQVSNDDWPKAIATQCELATDHDDAAVSSYLAVSSAGVHDASWLEAPPRTSRTVAVKSAPGGEAAAEVEGGQADAEGGDADAEVRDKLMQKLIALGWHAPPPTSRAMPVESAPRSS